MIRLFITVFTLTYVLIAGGPAAANGEGAVGEGHEIQMAGIASKQELAQKAPEGQEKEDRAKKGARTGPGGKQPVPLPPVEVTAEEPRGFDRYIVDPEPTPQTPPDAADLLRRTPGGNVASNGPISGQVQYRGLFGPRMNVLVDGMHIEPGGPNWMDPPLHYLPRSQLKSLEVVRGIAPVSSGLETIGGTVIATSRKSEFAETDAFEFHGSMEVLGRSVDNGFSGGTMLSASNNRHRLHILGGSDLGDDIEFGDGTIRASEHERHHAGIGYGVRLDNHEAGFDYRRTNTGDSGTPSLPMDIDFFHTNNFRGEYKGRLGAVRLQGKVYYTDVDHEMNNFKLRTTPPPAQRFVEATGNSFGYDVKGMLAFAGGELSFGADGYLAEHDMDIFDPTNPLFFVTQFNNTTRNRYGFFGEWNGQLVPRLGLELGVRYNRIEMDADPVDALPAQLLPPPMRLRNQFNAADRSQSDNNVDWVAKLTYQLLDDVKLELGGARKTRSPSHIERYLWLPLEVSAGLADLNNYVGNIGLDPEVSHEVELGFDWRTDWFYLSPRGFYRTVDDFIQGTAATNPDVIAVSTVNGDPTPLQFTNVDAELFGADAAMGVSLHPNVRLDGVISYVRGKRRDIDDDLFRIPPLNGRAALTYQQPAWVATVEGVFYAEQDKISRTIVINEPRSNNSSTPGFITMNLNGRWTPTVSPLRGLTLMVGIDNVLDKDYTDHLTGFNRVVNSDVPVGDRLPGPGRNFFARVFASF